MSPTAVIAILIDVILLTMLLGQLLKNYDTITDRDIAIAENEVMVAEIRKHMTDEQFYDVMTKAKDLGGTIGAEAEKLSMWRRIRLSFADDERRAQ